MSPIPVHRLSALCDSSDAAIAEDPPSRAPINKALIIGICDCTKKDQSPHVPGSNRYKLKGPHKDAKAVHRVLIDLYGYIDDQIQILLDDDDHIHPTMDNILSSIDNLVQDVHSGDRLVFYFAGHSGQDTDFNPEEEDGKDEYIVSSDGKWIRDDTLYEHLIQPLPRGCILRAVIDACHSGSLLDLSHSVCNRVYVPWISKGGKRKSKTLHYRTTRQGAILIPRRPKPRRHTSHPSQDNILPSKANEPASQGSRQNSRKSRSIVRNLSIRTDTTVLFPLENIYVPLTESPIAQTCSPERRFCDGIACFDKGLCDERVPLCTNILCLSSSRDGQKTWEDKDGNSMTSILVELLYENRNPTLHHMMTHVSHKIHEFYIDLHFAARTYQKATSTWRENNLEVEAGRKRKRSPVPTKTLSVETVNFQDPELSSPSPIMDMHTRLWDM